MADMAQVLTRFAPTALMVTYRNSPMGILPMRGFLQQNYSLHPNLPYVYLRRLMKLWK